jgi:hypothetical protein
MSMLDELLNSQNANVLKQLAGTFGVSEGDARSAVGSLLPALSRGISHEISNPSRVSDLMEALRRGNHQQYLDHPEALGREEAIEDGNAILGHLLGSKDVSRRVASHAADHTGLDAGILKKMLPMIAAMAMGAVSKQAASRGISNTSPGGGQDQAGMLGQLVSVLDADKDGSVMDDLLGMAGKFF